MNLPEGTIFRFTNPDARKDFTHGPWDQLCVALFNGELHACDGCYRRFNADGTHAGTVESLPLQSIEIVGIMPKSSKGAKQWDDSFAFPHGMKPGTVFQFKTKPKWWSSEYDWTTRMVVLFPVVAGLSLRVRFRRMLKDYPYTSEWDPTSDDFEIVGHLTPDQLYVTDSTVGLKPEHDTVTEKEIGITTPDVVDEEKPRIDPRFTEGTVFRLTGCSRPSWWLSFMSMWDKPCVVIDLSRSGDGAVPFRLLADSGTFDVSHFFSEADAFKIIGQLPSGKYDSIDLDDVVLPAQQLVLGTKFRFNKIPERWGSSINVKIEEVFSVIEHSGFTGVGQCVAKTVGPFKDGWWSAIDGVLPTDDIEIVADEVVEDKPEELELKLALGTKFRFTSRPDRWSSAPLELSTVFKVVEYSEFDGEGQAVQRDTATCPWCSRDGVLPSDDIEIFEDELVRLPVGTKFRFTEIPDRWDIIPNWINTKTVFEVIECDKFTGEGQCLSSVKNGQPEGVYSHESGVLPSDDIVFIDEVVDDGQSVAALHARIASLSKENCELRAVNWKSTACDLEKRVKELEKENGQLKGSISDWMASYYEAHRTIEQLGKKKPNAALAFIKKIW